MKVLQLCHKNPFPSKDGGCLAISAITKGLIDNGIDLHVLLMRTAKHYSDASAWPEEYRRKVTISVVDVDTTVNLYAAVKSLANRTSYNLSRFYSKEFEKQLIKILKEKNFDVILLESLFVCLYTKVIRKYSKAKIVYRSHNIESQIWERLAKGSQNYIKRWYLNILSSRLKRFEKQDLNNYDCIFSITEGDRNWYINNGAKKDKVLTIPFGVDLENYETAISENADRSVCFIGSLDWMPNIQGVNWFLNEIWPLVIKEVADAKFYLAGRSMSNQLKELEITGYVPVGEVDNAIGFFSPKSIMVVPLLTGGGMRVKVIEAMAVGKAIVSTTIGAENIEITNGKDMFIADTPAKFATCLIQLLNDSKKIKTFGENARSVIELNYDNRIIAKKIISIFLNITQVK